MTVARRAVIDVGTNSVKLLVADVGNGVVQPVLEDSEQTRLGAGFYETRRLQPKAIADSARAVGMFAAKARELNAVSTRVIATSAVREAVNPAELLSAIEQAAGVKVEIISGQQEADWAFKGVTSLPGLSGQPLLLLDVGGGSTQFILGMSDQKHFGQSFGLGTVRLLEALPLADPPTAGQLADCRRAVKDFLDQEVRPELVPALEREKNRDSQQREVRLVGTGGTASILARMEGGLEAFERSRIEGTELSAAQIATHVGRLWSLPLAGRKQIPGLPKNRADVILPGTVIFEGVLRAFGFSSLRITTRGLRFAAVLEEGVAASAPR